MAGFTTGEVEELLDLPASTLRFWEKEVPFLAPRKDVFGRRVYSSLDLCVLSRLKFLAFKRGLGLKKACAMLEKELFCADPALKSEIIQAKISLFALKAETMEVSKKLFILHPTSEAAEELPAPGQECPGVGKLVNTISPVSKLSDSSLFNQEYL